MSLKEQALRLPITPGCYIMRNQHAEIIYIGKAINLKRQVSSYFKKVEKETTKRLVHDATDIEVIHLDTEEEGLILESLLVGFYQPYYNQLLKAEHRDSYLKITEEKNPQLLITETVTSDGEFFGPFSSKQLCQQLYRFLENYYPLSKCQHNKGRRRLYVELGQCLGGCYREIDPAMYRFQKQNIRDLLEQSLEELIDEVTLEKDCLSRQQLFEKAQDAHVLLTGLKKERDRQPVLNKGAVNCDYLSIKETSDFCLFQVSHIRNQQVSVTNWWAVDGILTARKKLASLIAYYEHDNRQNPHLLFLSRDLEGVVVDGPFEYALSEGIMDDYFFTERQKKQVIAEKVYVIFKKYVTLSDNKR